MIQRFTPSWVYHTAITSHLNSGIWQTLPPAWMCMQGHYHYASSSFLFYLFLSTKQNHNINKLIDIFLFLENKTSFNFPCFTWGTALTLLHLYYFFWITSLYLLHFLYYIYYCFTWNCTCTSFHQILEPFSWTSSLLQPLNLNYFTLTNSLLLFLLIPFTWNTWPILLVQK